LSLHTLGDTLSDAPAPIKSSERRRADLLPWLGAGGLLAVLFMMAVVLARALAGVA
jgi:hypothetical protein